MQIREAVARAICAACGERPDFSGDANGNAYRWQDYADVADAAMAAIDAAMAAELESCGETKLAFEFPRHLEHPAGRVNLTAAYLFEYWANKGAIPRYDGVIDGLRDGANAIFKAAKPVRSNAELTGHGPKE